MHTITVMALVLRHSNYRDYDRMLTLLSPEQGRIDVIARGCRRPGSKMMGCSELFSYGQFVLRQKDDRYSVVQASIEESFYDLRCDVERYEAGCSILEALLQVSQSGQEAQDLFQLAYYTLSYMAYSDLHWQDILICFLLKLLFNQGYLPSTVRCARCGNSTFEGARFHPLLGTLCKDCGMKKGGEPLQALSIEAMRRMIFIPLPEMKNVKLPEGVRSELGECVPRFFIAHIGGHYQTRFFKSAEEKGH